MGGTITPFRGATAAHPSRSSVLETPCEQRQVAADGRIVCRKISKGDREVSPDLCALCPVAVIGCQHLRFTLYKYAPVPIVVRYAGGRVEVWDDVPPAMRFERAACALRGEAIGNSADCAGCALRMAAPVVMAMEEQHQSVATR